MAALARDSVPTRVWVSWLSVRIRASTGNAVTDIAVPMKVANAAKEMWCPDTVEWCGYSTVAAATPSEKASAMDDSETAAASRAYGRISLRSNSQPTTNMKSTRPTWETADSNGLTSTGNRRSVRWPGSRPSTL